MKPIVGEARVSGRGLSWAVVAVVAAFGAVALPGSAGVRARASVARRAAHAPTVVSLEFDHAFSDALPSIELAAREGIHVTLFAMSGRLGLPGYLTAEQLRAVQALGDEIGGHTIDHPDLAVLSPAAQHHEVCDDRTALQADGLNVADFAYPYGYVGAATPGIVRDCGYASARLAGDLASAGGCSGDCPLAETIPPQDPYQTRTKNSVLETTSLATLESYVTRVESSRGGWVQIVFHYVCDRCDPYSISPATLAAFLAWLAPRARLGTRTATVHEALSEPFRPPLARAARGGASPVRLDAARAVRLRGARALLVVTGDPASWVRLEVGARAGSLAGRAVDGGRTRWRVVVPALRRSAELVVRYPLGWARYRLRLAGP